jgi:uncharacterized damage-inducible protein DinB
MSAYDFLLDTYETERIKTLSVWSQFRDADMGYRPAPLSRTPHEQMVHQCLSEDAWMLKTLGIDSGLPALPVPENRLQFIRHYARASEQRLRLLRQQPEEWFQQITAFFDMQRPKSWILLRRLTHSAHHRAQLTVYLRLLGRPLYSTYGPTADTGGLFQNHARIVYRYATIDELLAAEEQGGSFPELPGPGSNSPTERPSGP